MGQKTFPDLDISDVGLERTEFERLLVDAFAEAMTALRERELPTIKRVVTRPNDTGFGPQEVTCTDFTRAIWDASDELSKRARFQKLAQYAFSRGAFRMNLRRDDSAMPERAAWDRFVWSRLVHAPLEYALRASETEELIRSGEAPPINVDDSLLSSIAAGVAERECQNRRTVEARCPVYLAITGEIGTYDLEPGTTLCCWSTQEQTTFITKYQSEYSFDDHMALFANSEIRVRCTAQGLSDGAAWASVCTALDRAKWALSVAAGSELVLGENPVVIRAMDGARVRTLRRASAPPDQAMALSRPLANIATEAAKILDRLSSLGEISALNRALWLLGRANNAALPRDALLDAVVGLESLLVPGPGEAAYRFALHGTAVLAADKQVYDELSNLYRLRSSAAHAGTASNFSDMAPRARQLLAQVILAIVGLIATKALAPLSDMPVGKAVQAWVRELVSSRAQRSHNL